MMRHVLLKVTALHPLTLSHWCFTHTALWLFSHFFRSLPVNFKNCYLLVPIPIYCAYKRFWLFKSAKQRNSKSPEQ